MAQINGELSEKKKLSGVLSRQKAAWLEAVILFGIGGLAVVLHQVLRAPLGLPGRHGLEWMALLVMGRAAGKSRLSGSTVGLGAATFSMLPLWGKIDDPFIWLIYLVPGIIMDLVVSKLPTLMGKAWFWALLGGLAHASKPLIRWVINLVTGFPYGSLLFGVLYPLGTHILFGLIGGLLGGLVILGGKRLIAKGESK